MKFSKNKILRNKKKNPLSFHMQGVLSNSKTNKEQRK